MRARAGTVVGLFAAGILVLQLGWAIVVPAFGGIDEIDHAYRAASVARGDWQASEREVDHGRGTLIRVPSDVVLAAHDRCEVLPYPEYYNCHEFSGPDEAGDVLVASGASRYNPAYYWVVGSAAKPFSGAAALYAMRIASLLLCTALLCAVLWVALACGHTLWPVAGLFLGLTPVMLYASSVAAPNGAQMVAAVLMWVAALALVLSPRRRERTLVALLAVAVPVVLVTHSLGPIWVALSAMTIAAAWPGPVVALWREHRRKLVALAVWCGVVLAFAAWWILSQKTNISGDEPSDLRPLRAADLLLGLVSWPLQTIGAVPFRNDYLPIPVFVIVLIPFVGFALAALVRVPRRVQLAMLAIIVVSLACGPALTALSYSSVGFVWQGRYSLPYAIGLLMLAAWVLDVVTSRGARTNVLIGVSFAAFWLAQAIALLSVADRQRQDWPLVDSLEAPSALLVGVMAATAIPLVASAAILAQRRLLDAPQVGSDQ